jgi:diguanylate cyclase (GGDEF)-like protein
MNLTFSLFKHMAMPVLFLWAGFLLADSVKSFPDNVIFLLAYVPYFFFVVSALLCVQFNQSRMLFSLLNIFLFYIVLHYLDFSILRLYEFILIFFALINIAVLVQIPERSILSVHSIIKLAVFAFQGFIIWYLLVYQFRIAEIIFFSTGFNAPPEWMNFSWLLLLAVVMAILSTSLKFIFQPGPIHASLLVFVLMLLALLSSASPKELVICLSLSVAIIAFVSVLFDSHQMAYRDELTGLRSRRALNQYLTGLGRKYTIAMLDIDHFKKFNDNHGHDIGDQMLRLVSSRIAKVTGGGTPFRYGGEEFTIVFPRKDIDDVMEHLDDLRDAIENYPLVIRAKDRPKKAPAADKKKKSKPRKEQALSCTISIGIACKDEEFKTPERVIKGADLALYRAKESGRNCLSI